MNLPHKPKPTGKRPTKNPRQQQLRVPPSSPLLSSRDQNNFDDNDEHPNPGAQSLLSTERLNQQLESEIKAGYLVPTLTVSPPPRHCTKRYPFENGRKGHSGAGAEKVGYEEKKWRLPSLHLGSMADGLGIEETSSPVGLLGAMDNKMDTPPKPSTTSYTTASSEQTPSTPQATSHPRPPETPPHQTDPTDPSSFSIPRKPILPPSVPPKHHPLAAPSSPFTPRTSPPPRPNPTKSPLSRPPTAHTVSTRHHIGCTSCPAHTKSSSRQVSSPLALRTPQTPEFDDAREVSSSGNEARDTPLPAPRRLMTVPLPSSSSSLAKEKMESRSSSNTWPEEKSSWDDDTESERSSDEEEEEDANGLLKEKRRFIRAKSGGSWRWGDGMVKRGWCEALRGGLLCRR